MTRNTIAVAALVLAVAACSKDKSEPADHSAANKAVEAEPGVAVVSANELGPQSKRTVSITTRSDDARSAFERGRELHENVRNVEAARSFERAVELDPEFALAHAYLGFVSDDKKTRQEHIEKALELSDKLPEAEQLLVKGLAARAKGDLKAEREIYDQLRKLAPRDHRVAMWMGNAARRFGDAKGATEAFELAIEINPRAAEPYNDLAYSYLYDGKTDKAVELAQTYARLKPTEPNPQDSLGEILMSAGRFEEADAAFRKALEIQPDFYVAYEGVALANAYRERWDEAVEAMKKAIVGTASVAMKVRFQRDLVWVQLAAGRTKAALATVTAIEKEIAANPGIVDKSMSDILRAEVLLSAGDLKAARKEATRLAEGNEWLRAPALVIRAAAEVELHKVDDAKATLGEIEAIAAKAGGDSYSTQLAFARGLVSLAEGDAKTAEQQLEAFKRTPGKEMPYVFQATWFRAKALDALGRSAEAEKIRGKLATDYGRDFYNAFAREQRFGSNGS